MRRLVRRAPADRVGLLPALPHAAGQKTHHDGDDGEHRGCLARRGVVRKKGPGRRGATTGAKLCWSNKGRASGRDHPRAAAANAIAALGLSNLGFPAGPPEVEVQSG